MNATTFGVDIAKAVFQVHWMEPSTGEIHRKKLTRAKVMEFFAKQAAATVVMEACGGAHHWARGIASLGHEVQLLPARQVRAFVTGNKDDAADARAIWLAAQHGDIRRVPLKSCEQQAQQSIHRMRSHWVSVRTASTNALRGLLYEFGITFARGRKIIVRALAEQRAHMEAALPAPMLRLIDEQLLALRQIEDHIEALEREIELARKSSELAMRLSKVPGIGVLGATALASTLGDGSGWRDAREFAACVGLTPSHSGTGGKVRTGGISKRGDAYLRTLLIHGGRNMARFPGKSEWVTQLLHRRPFNVVAVAIAHKLAKIAWAMAAHGSRYESRGKPAVVQTAG
jgi:transposase